MIEKSSLKLILALLLVSILLTFLNQILSIFLWIFTAFTVYFFRDPPRKIEDGIISPADGKIDFISGRRLEIFMSPFDCHVNRAPVDGKVLSVRFFEGKVLPANKRWENPRMVEITIESRDGLFKVIQIAGIFARRIVCYLKEGDIVRKGDKIGIIRFGSRVAIEVPEGFEFVKKVGDKVKAGEKIAKRFERS